MATLNNKISDILTEKTLKVRPENIKSGQTVFGIAGNVVELQGETKSVTPTTSAQTITPSSGKNGITQVNVSAVTSAIDNNIQAENIKSGVSILDVTGTYTGTAPTGTINITTNGTHDVTNYATASVNVPSITENDVNFYDYDGTLLHSYSKTAFLALTEMPSNPSHTGLTAQGWNWSLSDAKTHVTKYTKLNIGQSYTTTSGQNEFDIELIPATGKTVTFYMVGNKDWGDGTTDSTTSHTYTDYGKYTIKCDGSAIPNYVMDSANVHNYMLKHIRLATVEVGSIAFRECNALEDCSFSTGTTFASLGLMFYNCYCLKALMLPSTLTVIPSSICESCFGMKVVSLPNSAIIDNTTKFFSYNNMLKTITFPEGITSIPNSCFRGCYNLKELYIPSTVTSIAAYGLNWCSGLERLDFSNATSIPTIANTNAIANLTKACKIIVPDSLYETWITTSYWGNISNQIFKASEV